jgi:glycine cleavage system regulatory protein
VEPSSDYTLIKLTGTDRPELLLKASAVITNLDCNVVNACGAMDT